MAVASLRRVPPAAIRAAPRDLPLEQRQREQQTKRCGEPDHDDREDHAVGCGSFVGPE